MNWIFDAYANVYKTAMMPAMMQTETRAHDAAPAKERVHAKRAPLFGLFGQR